MKGKNLILFFLFLLSLTISGRIYAALRLTSLEIQSAIEDRVTPIVHRFDPQAIVFVKIDFKTKAQSLPGTPFVVNDLSVADNEGNARIDKIEISVMTQKTDFPPVVLGLIKEIVAPFGSTPQFKLRQLPHELVVKPSPSPTPLIPTKESVVKEHEREAAPAASPAPIKIDMPKMEFPNLPDYNSPLALIWKIGAGVLGALVLLLLGITVGWGKIGRAIERVAAEVQSYAAKGDEGQSMEKEQVTTEALTEEQKADEEAQSQNIYADLPEGGIVALLSDCYWGQFDGYAAFVWSRLSIQRRQKILKDHPLFSEYMAFAFDLPEVDLKAEQEPYYLAPWPINHMDNEALVKLVHKNPALWSLLPVLRRKALPISAREQLEMNQAAKGNQKLAALPQFDTIPASAKRSLKKNIEITLRTIEEETEILLLEGLTTEQMESIPSLGWLAKLPDEDAAEVLQSFTATDLASAWIGPEDLLEQLASLLPDNKLNLLQSYQARITASRESPAYKAIHHQTIERLKHIEQNPPEEADEEPAAEIQESA